MSRYQNGVERGTQTLHGTAINVYLIVFAHIFALSWGALRGEFVGIHMERLENGKKRRAGRTWDRTYIRTDGLGPVWSTVVVRKRPCRPIQKRSMFLWSTVVMCFSTIHHNGIRLQGVFVEGFDLGRSDLNFRSSRVDHFTDEAMG